MSSKIRSLVAKFSADMQSFNKDIQNATNAMKNGFGNLDLSQTNSALKGLNDSIRLSDSEFKKATAGMDNWKNNADGLRARLKYLNDVIDDQKTKLKGMNRQLELTEQKYGKDSKEANNLRIKINNQTAAIKKNELELKNVTGDLDKFGKETKDASKQSSLLGDIFKGGFFANIAANALRTVITKLKEFVKATFTVADEINRLSLETGISTEKLQEMKYVTTILDGDLNLLAKSQAKLTRAMSEAKDGVAEYKDAFEKLGWTVDDITNSDGTLRDATEVMYDMLGALGDIENATERDAIALDIFGRSAQQLNPLIKAGSERMAELSEEAHKMGAVMSDEAVQALDLLHDRFEATKQTVTAFVGEALAGLIKTLSKPTVDSLTKAAQTLDDVADSSAKVEAKTIAAGAVALDYVKKLDDLATQGLDTAEAHDEYAGIVEKLNALVPDLNVVIDEQTGLMENNTGAVKANVKAWLASATALALQEKYTDTMDAYGKAQAEVIVNEVELQNAHLETAAIEGQLDIALRQLGEGLGLTGENLTDFTEGMAASRVSNADFAAALMATGVSADDLTTDMYDLRTGLIASEDSEKTFQKAIEEGKAELTKYADDVALAEQAVEGLTDATKENAETVKKATDVFKDHETQSQRLTKKTDLLNAAIKEQNERGTLSKETYDKLTAAGYENLIQKDAETGAIRINEEAYQNLTIAQWETIKAQMELERSNLVSTLDAIRVAQEKVAHGAYQSATAMYYQAAAAKAVKDEIVSYDVFIAEIEAKQKAVGSYTASVSRSGSAAKSATSKMSDSFKKAVKEIGRALELGEIDQEEYWVRYEALMKGYLKEGTEDWEDANDDLLKGQRELFDDINDAAKKGLQSLKDEYDDAFEEIQDNIDSMADKIAGIDLANKIKDEEGNVSYEFTGLADLQKGNEEILKLQESLDALDTMGISDSLMAQIGKMSTEEAIAYSEYLLGLGQDGFDAYMAEWGKRQELAKAAATSFYQEEIDTLHDEFLDKMTEELAGLNSDMYNVGEAVAKGLADGILSGSILVEAAMSQLRDAALGAAEDSFEISSPSKLMKRKIGIQIPAGVAEGIKENINLVEKAMAAMNAVNNSDLTSMTALPVVRNMQGGDSHSSMADTIASRVSEAIAGMQGGRSGDLIISVPVNGAELARATIRDFRQAENENPEVKGDF